MSRLITAGNTSRRPRNTMKPPGPASARNGPLSARLPMTNCARYRVRRRRQPGAADHYRWIDMQRVAIAALRCYHTCISGEQNPDTISINSRTLSSMSSVAPVLKASRSLYTDSELKFFSRYFTRIARSKLTPKFLANASRNSLSSTPSSSAFIASPICHELRQGPPDSQTKTCLYSVGSSHGWRYPGRTSEYLEDSPCSARMRSPFQCRPYLPDAYEAEG